MKLLKILLYILLGGAALVVLLGLFAKKDYHIERSIEIDASKAMVYEYARYFKNFEQWSPWSAYDPNLKQVIEGTDGALGATYKWSGNDKVGVGEQTITAISPDRIDMEIRFQKPWESTSPVFLSFEDAPEGKTKVNWGFDMHVDFPWNGMAMFTNVDAGVGKDYERGLETLKKNCELLSFEKYRGLKAMALDMPAQTYVGVRKTMPIAEIGAFYGTTMGAVMEALGKKSINPNGAPAGLYWKWDEEKQETDLAAVIPVLEDPKLGKDFQVFQLPAGQALVIDFKGSYDKIGDAHQSMDAWMADKNLQAKMPVIEAYVSDPGTEPDTSKWLTKVIYFVEPKK